jgi:hypothetical protein
VFAGGGGARPQQKMLIESLGTPHC